MSLTLVKKYGWIPNSHSYVNKTRYYDTNYCNVNVTKFITKYKVDIT